MLYVYTAKFALLVRQGFNSLSPMISWVLHHLVKFYFFLYNVYLFVNVPRNFLQHIQKDFGT